MNKKYYCMVEYGYIASKKSTDFVDKGCVLIDNDAFEELESFVLQNGGNTDSPEVSNFITISYKKGIGKILKAQNYVGLIQTKSGSTIEILPKIYDGNGELSYKKTINIFFKMLKSLREAPFKKFNLSSLKISNMNLWDVFINMFLIELDILIKRGIKSAYIENEDNLNFYKGKLNVNKHIQHNASHKEKFYVYYDEFSPNRAENKIIKTTLEYINKKTRNSKLQVHIRRCIFAFDEVSVSNNIKRDFEKCTNNRVMNDYDLILKWCEIFLENKSFMNYKGGTISYSLLFPMEKIFESYVAANLKKSEEFKKWNIYVQHNKYYLIENPQIFKLRPDIVIENDKKIIILDTKWKLLNDDSNYGISQSDLYQMYAYAKKYKAENIILIYPLNSCTGELKENISMAYEENLKLNIFFVDLSDMNTSVKRLSCLISKIDAEV